MNYPQAEEALERIEIAVSMKEGVVFLQAECRDPTVDGLANREASASQLAIVVGGCESQLGASGREYRELQKAITDVCRLALGHSLQDFA